MKLTDILTAKAIAIYWANVASNSIPYLGRGLFPVKKKAGLDLKWIKTSKGLPVSLAPSTFDSKATIRSREGISIDKTEMAFFRESFLIKETDEQEVMRVQDSSDPFAQAVIDSIYSDSQSLIDGAEVVPERMIMQLLSPSDGSPKISIQANGTTYAYNYDADGTYVANNFLDLTVGTYTETKDATPTTGKTYYTKNSDTYTKFTGESFVEETAYYELIASTDAWSDTVNSDPMADIQVGIDAVESRTGTRPSIMIVSKKTMGYLLKNETLKSAILAQNVSANIFMTESRVKDLFSAELGVTIVIYSKKYKDETGITKSFYPDDMATLIPDGTLGNTWYGTTPEERTLIGEPTADVALVNNAIAVTVYTTPNPVNTNIIASEIVLPSYERMDETYVIKVA